MASSKQTNESLDDQEFDTSQHLVPDTRHYEIFLEMFGLGLSPPALPFQLFLFENLEDCKRFLYKEFQRALWKEQLLPYGPRFVFDRILAVAQDILNNQHSRRTTRRAPKPLRTEDIFPLPGQARLPGVSWFIEEPLVKLWARWHDLCGNCGGNGHVLADCNSRIDKSGYVCGCPRCNTREHLFDDCLVEVDTRQEFLDLVKL